MKLSTWNVCSICMRQDRMLAWIDRGVVIDRDERKRKQPSDHAPVIATLAL